MNSENFFVSKIKEYALISQRLTKRSNQLAILRLAVFVLIIAIIVLLTSITSLGIIIFTGVAGLIIFIWLVSYHKDLEQKINLYQALKGLNEEELSRTEGKFPGYHDGISFIDKKHPFSYDLDLFGDRSLFHHINRCHLPISEKLLADFLTNTAAIDQIPVRQRIIETLTEHIDWVQEYIATLKINTYKITAHPDLGFLKTIKLNAGITLVSWFLRAAAIAAIALYFLDILPFVFIILSALINYWVMVKYSQDIFSAGVKSNVLIRHIRIHLSAMKKIDGKTFSSPETDFLVSKVTKDSIREIKKLESTIRWIDSRNNPFYAILNAIFLMDLYSYHQLALWIHKNSENLDDWFDTVYKVEMYSSIAAWRFHHKEYTWPEFSENDYVFEAFNMGHPLINESQVITNDFTLSNSKIHLVTGSNMSGKSTFLRTVGLNTLMAWIGLPVFASNMTVSRFILFTSMRTQDNLAESTSSFYAELKRISELFRLIDHSDIPVLFFLDEILKGTNSDDRHSGARGIIEKLIKKECTGFISTHDLQLADDYQDHINIENISFNSYLEDDQLIFDYKLTPGKCQSSNATLLMKSMNIID